MISTYERLLTEIQNLARKYPNRTNPRHPHIPRRCLYIDPKTKQKCIIGEALYRLRLANEIDLAYLDKGIYFADPRNCLTRYFNVEQVGHIFEIQQKVDKHTWQAALP